PRGGAHGRRGGAAHLRPGRAAPAEAHRRDAGGAQLPRLVERLHVAPHRAHRPRRADAPGRAGRALARARAGRGADDGRGRDHGAAGAAALPGPAAVLHAGPPRGRREGMRGIALVLAALAIGARGDAAEGEGRPGPGGRVVLDLEDMGAWQVRASDQVGAVLRRDGDGSVCLEYDFHAVSGYAVLTQVLPVQWPAAFALQLRMKGYGAVNDFQVKLLDASGEDVWWVNRPAFPLPRSLTDVTFKSRHFSFAW